MKDNIYIKDFDSYENIINKFEEYLAKITEIFSKQNQNFEKINRTETWTGKAQENTSSLRPLRPGRSPLYQTCCHTHC